MTNETATNTNTGNTAGVTGYTMTLTANSNNIIVKDFYLNKYQGTACNYKIDIVQSATTLATKSIYSSATTGEKIISLTPSDYSAFIQSGTFTIVVSSDIVGASILTTNSQPDSYSGTLFSYTSQVVRGDESVSVNVITISDAITKNVIDNTKLYYKLDETSGTIVTDSVSDIDGTSSGATVNQVGKIDKAYTWSSDGLIDSNQTFDDLASNEFSASIWFKINSNGIRHYLVSNRNYDDGRPMISIEVYSDNKIDCVLRSTDGTTWSADISDTINVGQWYHLVVTGKVGGNLVSYLDGTAKTTTAVTAGKTITGSNQNLCFGGLTVDGVYNRATLDEIGFWNRELSSTEVTELYNSGNGISYPFSITKYTLSFTQTGNGTITKNPNWSDYYATSEVIITAVPTDENSRFRDWSGDLVSTTNPETVTMDANKTIACYFETRTIIIGGVTF
jgi:hypothetical protein